MLEQRREFSGQERPSLLVTVLFTLCCNTVLGWVSSWTEKVLCYYKVEGYPFSFSQSTSRKHHIHIFSNHKTEDIHGWNFKEELRWGLFSELCAVFRALTRDVETPRTRNSRRVCYRIPVVGVGPITGHNPQGWD